MSSDSVDVATITGERFSNQYRGRRSESALNLPLVHELLEPCQSSRSVRVRHSGGNELGLNREGFHVLFPERDSLHIFVNC